LKNKIIVAVDDFDKLASITEEELNNNPKMLKSASRRNHHNLNRSNLGNSMTENKDTSS
jgi:hypothetical protein